MGIFDARSARVAIAAQKNGQAPISNWPYLQASTNGYDGGFAIGTRPSREYHAHIGYAPSISLAGMDIEANPRYIAFDAVEIDLVGRRLTIGGVETALEPKAFDVLALLAQEPGKAFARDDILDAVWGHRHVTPGVLTRVIVLIRQALGESAHTLHTLHGIGYRFDGETRFFSHREATTASGDAADPVASAAITAVSPVAAASTTPISEPVGPNLQSTASSPAVPAAIRPASRRWSLLLIAAFAAIAAGIFLWQARHRETTPASPTLVVLPLHAIGDGKSEAVFADGLSEELTTRLARVEGLHLISSTSAARAQHDGFDATQLAERLHVTHALEGSLREEGRQLRIDLRLIETPSGRTVWAQDYDRKLADVFALQQQIAQAVASALSLRIGLAQNAAKPPDPEVFREYLEIRHLLLVNDNQESWTKGAAALKALVARAPDFAPARGHLALVLAGWGQEDEALRDAEHALALDPNELNAHAALGTLAFNHHDWITAMKEYYTALALDPSDTVLHLLIGMRLARLGYGNQALAMFEAGYASDPLNVFMVFNLGTQLDVLGRHDEAKHYLDLEQEFEPVHQGWATTDRWRNAVWRRDFAEARALAAQLPEKEGFRKAYVATTEALVDPTAWPAADAAIAENESKVGAPILLRRFEPEPNPAALLADFASGDQEAEGSGMVWAAPFTALRRDPAFQDFIKRMKFIDYWNANGWPPQCKPDGDGARCD